MSGRSARFAPSGPARPRRASRAAKRVSRFSHREKTYGKKTSLSCWQSVTQRMVSLPSRARCRSRIAPRSPPFCGPRRRRHGSPSPDPRCGRRRDHRRVRLEHARSSSRGFFVPAALARAAPPRDHALIRSHFARPPSQGPRSTTRTCTSMSGTRCRASPPRTTRRRWARAT